MSGCAAAKGWASGLGLSVSPRIELGTRYSCATKVTPTSTAEPTQRTRNPRLATTSHLGGPANRVTLPTVPLLRSMFVAPFDFLQGGYTVTRERFPWR